MTSLYSDIDLNFGINPLTKDITKKLDVNAINQSLKIILLTMFYEVPFNSAFGSSINKLLFEPITPMTDVIFQKIINEAIHNYEPRVSVNSIKTTFDLDTNIINITIEYTILLSSKIQTFELVLKRSR